jgi:hypothetical protein
LIEIISARPCNLNNETGLLAAFKRSEIQRIGSAADLRNTF